MSDTSITLERSPFEIRWTREDCERLEEAGILNYRYELVEGAINRLGQNTPHANMVRLLILWLIDTFGRLTFLSQTSIDVRPEDNPTSRPQPDGILLRRSAESLTEDPKPADISLLIEAADSTVRYDLTTKARLYARAGIVEYWVVCAPERELVVHRAPRGGVYQSVQTYHEDEQVASLAAPDRPVLLSKLLPVIGAQFAE